MDGKRVSHYLIERKIGVGGMATVYKATDGRTQAPVALKILHSHWAVQPEIVHRFRREAEVASRLRHPHIATVHDFGMTDNRPFLVMQYLAGGNLAQRFRQPSRLSLWATARLVEQVATALDFAHDQGVIHRDLKLENILLDQQHRPYLSDFGIARVLDATRLTLTDRVTGTPRYMAPEQARGQGDVDHRADIYSFAVIAYLLATGYHPFTATDPIVLLNQHMQITPPLPTRVNPALPLQIDTVLLKGLAKSPDDRYQSAGAFAADYADALTGHSANRTLVDVDGHNPVAPDISNPIATQPVQAVMEGDITPERQRRFGHRWVVVLALVAAGAVGALALMSPEDASPDVVQITPLSPHTPETVRALPPAGRTPVTVPTFTPRVTRPPTTTPTVTPFPGDARVTGEFGVNLRRGANITFDVVVNLSPNTPLKLVGRTADSRWYQARTLDDDWTGWVYSELVTVYVNVQALPITWLNASPTDTATPTFTPTPRRLPSDPLPTLDGPR